MVFAQETRASRRPGAVARGLVPRSHAIRCRRVCSASAVQHVEVLWPGARLAPAGDKPPPYRRWRGRRSEPARLTSFARYPSGIAGTAESSSAVPAVLAGIRPAEARGLEQAACMAAGGGFWLHPLSLGCQPQVIRATILKPLRGFCRCERVVSVGVDVCRSRRLRALSARL